uniref:Uncharacterized protein n=1 Tax=Romanomermis culicivorax TaxID=13658 RepID=A0A915JB68_ROMCU
MAHFVIPVRASSDRIPEFGGDIKNKPIKQREETFYTHLNFMLKKYFENDNIYASRRLCLFTTMN